MCVLGEGEQGTATLYWDTISVHWLGGRAGLSILSLDVIYCSKH